MKRLRLEKWSGQLLSARPGAARSSSSRPTTLSPAHLRVQRLSTSADQFSASAAATAAARDARPYEPDSSTPPYNQGEPSDSTSTEPNTPGTTEWSSTEPPQDLGPPPSPLPSRALRSAKLAALHARLGLSNKIPLQTLARTLVDASADPAPLFNNTNLAFLGQTLISYHTSEMLMCRYPRLPMEIMHAAMKAYAGDKTLYYVARSWGIETAAAPGEEVDPGLLQFSLDHDRSFNTKWGVVRTNAHLAKELHWRWRRGISSRVVYDDDFGEVVETPAQPENDSDAQKSKESQALEDESLYTPLESQNFNAKIVKAHNINGTFVRAVVGAIYTHSGREIARSFIKSHILSRQLELSKLFSFKMPIRELSRLCAREEFEPPVARLLSETGRLSRTPVFVVGIFSGGDKLGEGSASSLEHARKKAAMNALKAWYLYSPGEHVRVPSDMMLGDTRPWEPVYMDMGEVITGV